MVRLPPHPDLDWRDDGVPRAAAFEDVYFSRAGGLAETEAVFLAGCGLPEAWAGRRRFAICELGFGTGLNVLATWRAWRKTRIPHAILHIASIEAFPLAKPDAARALAAFPEIADLAAPLLARWPVRAYAPQRLWFAEDGLALTLFTGAAESVLAGLGGRFDAWFLDGFAPARNPDMWSAPLFADIARLSAPRARLASFTVAGAVRRGLSEAGFSVEKKPGFGAKRERLEARFTGAVAPAAETAPKRAAVIGAGIAGAGCARALTRRGVETIVLEAGRALGAGASGNPAGLVMPRLDRGGPLAEMFLAAYLDAVAAYEALGAPIFRQCGVEERARKGGGDALADLIADPPLPEDWFTPLGAEAALHKRAGVLDPVAATAAFLDRADVSYEAEVSGLERAGEGWIVRGEGGRALLKADAVVLACGSALARFAPARFLPIELSRGQVEWGEGEAPVQAMTRGSYCAPYQGGLLFGATFDRVSAAEAAAVETDASSRTRNLAALAELAPALAAALKQDSLRSRASVRAATPDRAPIAGLLPDAEAWAAREGERDHEGLYVLGGLGARGLVLAPLLGELIASEMFAEPAALSQAARDAIHPVRFLKRAMKRGKL